MITKAMKNWRLSDILPVCICFIATHCCCSDVAARFDLAATSHISGGRYADPQLEEATVILFSDAGTGETECSGSIITEQHVLTAAHCVYDDIDTKTAETSIWKTVDVDTTSVQFVGFKFLGMIQKLKVHSIVIYSGYVSLTDGRDPRGDLAVLTVDRPFPKGIASFRLASLSDPVLLPGQTLWTAGYGETGPDVRSVKRLRAVSISYQSYRTCRTIARLSGYSVPKQNSVMCAVDTDFPDDFGRDSSRGDSGGPLFVRINDRLVMYGVIWYGPELNVRFEAGVYTNVPTYHEIIQVYLNNTSIYTLQ